MGSADLPGRARLRAVHAPATANGSSSWPSCASVRPRSRRGGGEKALERHRSRGKLTARERVDRLCDPDTAFLELSALAAWEMYDGQSPGAGIVTGSASSRDASA